MANFSAIATQFTDYYYPTFGTKREELRPLYRDDSMLYWNGEPFQGVNNIIPKLTALPFSKVTHNISTVDAQPSSPTISSIVVLVTGFLLIDDDKNPLSFSQLFHLIPDSGGSYYVLNDVFRLNVA